MGEDGPFRREKIKSEQRSPGEREGEGFTRAVSVMFYSLFKCSLMCYPMALFISEGVYRVFSVCEALGGMAASTRKVRALLTGAVN